MKIYISGLETNTGALKADLNTLKSDFEVEMVATRATRNIIPQALQPQTSVPTVSTRLSSQPPPQPQY